MADSLPSAAKRLSMAGQLAVGVATAMVAFAVAIISPPLVLAAAVVAVILAMNLRLERDPSAPLLAALAAGCAVATAIYAALAIANIQDQSPEHGTQTVPPKALAIR